MREVLEALGRVLGVLTSVSKGLVLYLEEQRIFQNFPLPLFWYGE